MRITIITNNFGDGRFGGGQSNQMTVSVPTNAFENNQKLTITGDRQYSSNNQFARPYND